MGSGGIGLGRVSGEIAQPLPTSEMEPVDGCGAAS